MSRSKWAIGLACICLAVVLSMSIGRDESSTDFVLISDAEASVAPGDPPKPPKLFAPIRRHTLFAEELAELREKSPHGVRFSFIGTTTLQLRTAPRADAPVISALWPGQRIAITDKSYRGWRRVFDLSSGAAGWIPGEFEEAAPIAAAAETVAPKAPAGPTVSKAPAPRPKIKPVIEQKPAEEHWNCPCR